MEKYLYTVNPRMPIRNVIPGQLITRESNLSLDLEQVKACLKFGPVYRKFANANQTIQVTLENCERLHQRDYVQIIEPKSTFIPPQMKEIPPVEIPVEKPQPVVEETKEEPVVEEAVQEENVSEEEPTTEEVSEDETEVEDVVEEDTPSTNNHHHNNYNGKQKKYKK